MKVLLRMKHGLGDNAQFTIVMRHIQYYFPDWEIDIIVGRGKQSYFKQFASRILLRKEDEYNFRNYDRLLDVDWPPANVCSPHVPSTKVTRFLQNYLHVEPIADLYKGYEITITSKEQQLADEYVATLPNKPFAIVHYLAKTLKFAKSLTHNDALFICKQILKQDCTPVVLDWKNESPLPDQQTIYNPGADNAIWQGESLSSAGTIAALISRAKLYVGVDSGPLHVAGCTRTPTLAIWHGHHPINFYDLCDNVTHLVPESGRGLKAIKGQDKPLCRTYFEKEYNHVYYKHLPSVLMKEIRKKLK